MDFEVHAENILFANKSDSGNIRRSNKPSHSTIAEDLRIKKEENPQEYEKVRLLIDRIYNCDLVNTDELISINLKKGYPFELMLKIVKWLFIERDVTYWNWSGRKMFYNKLFDI